MCLCVNPIHIYIFFAIAESKETPRHYPADVVCISPGLSDRLALLSRSIRNDDLVDSHNNSSIIPSKYVLRTATNRRWDPGLRHTFALLIDVFHISTNQVILTWKPGMILVGNSVLVCRQRHSALLDTWPPCRNWARNRCTTIYQPCTVCVHYPRCKLHRPCCRPYNQRQILKKIRLVCYVNNPTSNSQHEAPKNSFWRPRVIRLCILPVNDVQVTDHWPDQYRFIQVTAAGRYV